MHSVFLVRQVMSLSRVSGEPREEFQSEGKIEDAIHCGCPNENKARDVPGLSSMLSAMCSSGRYCQHLALVGFAGASREFGKPAACAGIA